MPFKGAVIDREIVYCHACTHAYVAEKDLTLNTWQFAGLS